MQFRALCTLFLTATAATSFLGCHVQKGIIHRVEQGETLAQVAHLYEIDVPQLLRANPMHNPNMLLPGQKLLIPGVDEVRRGEQMVWNFEQAVAVNRPPPIEEKKRPVESSPQKPEAKKAWRSTNANSPSAVVDDASRSSLIWPVEGRVISPFGMRGRKMHNGIDVSVAPGSAVRTCASGKVMYEGKGVKGYGNLVIVGHGGKLFSIYAYLGEIYVEKGKILRQGEMVGTSQADPANAFIHFEIRKGRQAFDPTRYLTSGPSLAASRK